MWCFGIPPNRLGRLKIYAVFQGRSRVQPIEHIKVVVDAKLVEWSLLSSGTRDLRFESYRWQKLISTI